MRRTDSKLRGQDHPRAKLRPYQIAMIRDLSARDFGHKRIARIFAVSPTCARKIIARETWGWM